MSNKIRAVYKEELQLWFTNGWLIPYPQEYLGPPKGLIPLMAIMQSTKDKVQSVMDYRELNQLVDAFITNADMCAAELREWRQQEVKVALLDLWSAYM